LAAGLSLPMQPIDGTRAAQHGRFPSVPLFDQERRLQSRAAAIMDKGGETRMDIHFPEGAHVDIDSGGVMMPIFVNNDRIWCNITQECLEDVFNASDDLLKTFNENRRSIEAVAEHKARVLNYPPVFALTQDDF
jgi:hypothetical protein